MRTYTDCEACVDAILERLGKRIVLGTPLGIGKPNALLNALYRRAKADPSIQLDLVTALSLNPPLGKSELEERYLKPVRARVWPGYPRLEFVDDRAAGTVPPNIRVIEFYMQSGALLHNALAQQNYISSNYSQVAHDMLLRGVNLLLQAVALREEGGRRRLSLSSNPDITLQLIPLLHKTDRPWMACAQVNRELPWMGHHAEVGEDFFHCLVDNPALDHAPFAVPHEPVNTTDWAIGVRASSLVRDCGTLQVGIGALGDAACHALRLRQSDNAGYGAVLDALGADPAAEAVGGRGTFGRGLYVASELISNPLFVLFEEGIVRRRVWNDAALQQSADKAFEQRGGEAPATGGIAMEGAFFVGPADFYRRLRELPEERRALIDMNSVGEVNSVVHDFEIERLKRRHPRFINITMKLTLLGAAISDQVGDGQLVSGVGGQFDFVSMAHQLPEGRSILLLRATRGSGGKLESNLVWEFPHATIPRHLRDLFVTEYGVADLRGKTDAECIAALLAIADSRFQQALLEQAQRAGKMPRDYLIPEAQRANLPQRIAAALAPHQKAGRLPPLPFGCDLNEAERGLMARLNKLKSAGASWGGRWRLLGALANPAPADAPEVAAALRHLQLAQPDSAGERRLARLVRAAFKL
ncbi:MAG TPA: acetyl-CoA hydrolase/transferase C-terminal domain-containing protein [Nevskia sp.]|nr:acetyl-CoA hydrolase/transferase C-terminal domain-containing protein [Nevskia sp.]